MKIPWRKFSDFGPDVSRKYIVCWPSGEIDMLERNTVYIHHPSHWCYLSDIPLDKPYFEEDRVEATRKYAEATRKYAEDLLRIWGK